jgi:hypothetical protein
MNWNGLNAIVLQKLSGNIQVTRLGIWVAYAGKQLSWVVPKCFNE